MPAHTGNPNFIPNPCNLVRAQTTLCTPQEFLKRCITITGSATGLFPKLVLQELAQVLPKRGGRHGLMERAPIVL